MRIVSISLAAALVTAVTFASAFAAERWQRLPAAPAMPASKVAGYAPGQRHWGGRPGAADPWRAGTRRSVGQPGAGPDDGPHGDRGGQPRPRPVLSERRGLITVPTAIVLGDHDEAITRAHTEHMAQVIPGATLAILPDASHFAMLQDPAGCTKAVRDFLAAN